MTNVNNFAIIGHLTADAEEFNIGNKTYVSFRVAVNRGQNKDASFIPVRAPKKFISDTLRAKLTKGASVLVSGRFESGHYEKDGQKKFYDYLSAATIQHDVNGGFSEGLLMGNLTADVVTRNTQNGGTMVTFTVASNRSYQKNGNWENATSYVSCAANGKTAEFIAAHFHKGDPIMLVGVLTSNQSEPHLLYVMGREGIFRKSQERLSEWCCSCRECCSRSGCSCRRTGCSCCICCCTAFLRQLHG